MGKEERKYALTCVCVCVRACARVCMYERERERATVEGIRRFSLVQWGFADRSLNPDGRTSN